MNTLYLGYYDYPYSGEAYIFNDGKFEKYELSDTEIDMLYYFYLVNGDRLEWSNYWGYSRDELDKCVEKLSAVFDDIVACNDGTFKYIKLNKGE